MADLIQMPRHLVNFKLSDLETDMNYAETILKKFKETRELKFLFELVKIVNRFGGQWYYLVNTILDTEQKNRLRNLAERENSIDIYIIPEIAKLSRCKV